ncbi:MAG TPA: hypothetical protein VE758_07755, partial [Chthoniobacterales bacterium]|nr:hypothetical protein [Chthoniobacterales bacterium]
NWPGFRLRYRYGNTLYRVAVENPEHCSHGIALVEVDRNSVADKIVRLRDDAVTHDVRVVLGTKPPA